MPRRTQRRLLALTDQLMTRAHVAAAAPPSAQQVRANLHTFHTRLDGTVQVGSHLATSQGGHGIVQLDTSGYFTMDQQEEALEFFRGNGYTCIVGALSPREVSHLNEFCDRTQASDPKAWGIKRNREGYHTNQGLIFSQPWLDHPELDQYAVNHPSFKSVVESCLGGPQNLRTYEFNFRESPAGAGQLRMNFHHDSVHANRLEREPYFPLDAMCCIRYLTDVTPATPAFAVVPRSRRHDSLETALAELVDQYKVR
jgi:hypothetical protein